MLISRDVVGKVLIGMMVVAAGMVGAQDYPSKPVRIQAGSAGGGGDFAARTVAQGISGPLGQPVIVENNGTGFIGADKVQKSAPDGYNLLLAGGSTWIFPLLVKAPYDPVNDFLPISLLVREVQVLVVHPSLPVKTVKELIAFAKTRSGQLNYGSIAVGASQHLGTELLKSMAGINLVHVPYKGGIASVTALISGEAQVLISDLGLVSTHMKSGRLRALAVTSATPSVLAPGLPTVAADLPGFEVVGATGIWAPAKTPAAIITRLNQEIVRALNRPEAKEKFISAGAEVVASSPEQFAAHIKSEMATFSKVIKDAGISIK